MVRFHFPTASQRIKRKTVGKCREMYGRCGSGSWRNSKGIEIDPRVLEYTAAEPTTKATYESFQSLSLVIVLFVFLVAQTPRRANWDRKVVSPHSRPITVKSLTTI